MRPELRGTLAILCSSLGYATLPVIGKLALDAGVEVLPLLAWRFLIGAALVWGVVAIARRPLPGREVRRPLLALGALYATNSLAFMIGLDRVSASLASLVFFTYPAVTVLLARAILGEALTARRLGSLLLASVGCGLTVGLGARGGDAVGVIWILLAVALIAVFIVSSHPVLERSPELGGSATLMTATAIILTAATLATGSLAIEGGLRVVVYVVLLGLLSTALPVTLFLIGIKLIGPGRAAIFSTMEPAFTVLLAAIVLGERLAPVQLAGGILIISAVVWLRLERPLPEEPSALETR